MQKRNSTYWDDRWATALTVAFILKLILKMIMIVHSWLHVHQKDIAFVKLVHAHTFPQLKSLPDQDENLVPTTGHRNLNLHALFLMVHEELRIMVLHEDANISMPTLSSNIFLCDNAIRDESRKAIAFLLQREN